MENKKLINEFMVLNGSGYYSDSSNGGQSSWNNVVPLEVGQTLNGLSYKVEISEVTEDYVEVEVYEETDAEFGRRVRFNIKVEEFRNRQSLRELEEAKKPKFIRKFNEFKTELNRVSNKAFDEFIDRLGR